MVSSVSKAGLDCPGSSTRAVISHLSDSHPQQSSLKGNTVVYILRDTGLPLPLFSAVFSFANTVSIRCYWHRVGVSLSSLENKTMQKRISKNCTCSFTIYKHEDVQSSYIPLWKTECPWREHLPFPFYHWPVDVTEMPSRLQGLFHPPGVWGVVSMGRFAVITAGSGRLIPRECRLNLPPPPAFTQGLHIPSSIMAR